MQADSSRMETLDLWRDLSALLEKEVGVTGKFILKKQCQAIGLNPEKIMMGDLEPLSEKIYHVIKSYLGEQRAEKVREGLKEYRNALETTTQPPPATDAVTDEMVEAQITLGDKNFHAGLLDEAQLALDRALEVLSETEDGKPRVIHARALRKLARVLGNKKGKREESKKLYEEAIMVAEKLGDPYELALSWCGLAEVLRLSGDHRAALEHYQSANRAIRRMDAESRHDKSRKKRAEAKIESGLGNVYLDLNMADKSIEHNERALDIFEQYENWAEAGRVYNNLARVYEEIQDYDSAIAEYESGIRYCVMGGAKRMEGRTMTNLASALIAKNRLNECFAYLKRAEDLLSEYEDPLARSKLHCMYGRYYRSRRQWEEGIEHLTKSIKCVEGEGMPDHLCIAREELGSLYQQMGELDKAEEFLEGALDWYKVRGEERHIARITAQLDEIRKGR